MSLKPIMLRSLHPYGELKVGGESPRYQGRGTCHLNIPHQHINQEGIMFRIV